MIIFSILTLMLASRDSTAIIPNDTIFVIEVNQPGKVYAEVKQASYVKVFHDDSIRRIFAPLLEAFDSEDDPETEFSQVTGITFDDFMAMLEGDVVLGAVFRIEEGDEPFVFLLADIGGNEERIAQALTKALEYEQDNDADTDTTYQVRDIEEEFKGERIHLRQRVSEESLDLDMAWAIAGGHLIVSEELWLAQDLISNVLDEGPSDVSSKVGAMMKESEDADLRAFLDLGKLMAELRHWMEDDSAQSASFAQADQLLGLQHLKSLHVSVDFNGDGVWVDLGVDYAAGFRLADIFAFQQGALPKPTHIPTNAASANSALFSIPSMVDTIEKLVLEINPQAADQWEAVIKQFASATDDPDREFRLKQTLLNNLGQEVTGYRMVAPAGIETQSGFFDIATINVIDEETARVGLNDLAFLIEGAIRTFAPDQARVEHVDALGTQIHSIYFNADGEQGQAHMAIANHMLILNFDAQVAITQAISDIQSRSGTFWQRGDVIQAQSQLPDGLVGFSYTDVNETLLHTYLKPFQALGVINSVSDADVEALADAFGSIVTGVYQTESSTSFRFQMLAPKD